MISMSFVCRQTFLKKNVSIGRLSYLFSNNSKLVKISNAKIWVNVKDKLSLLGKKKKVKFFFFLLIKWVQSD